jgi:hypothetical protein
LKAVDRGSPNLRLLDDYAVFFTNYRCTGNPSADLKEYN